MSGHLGISCQVTADGARSTQLPQAGLIRPSVLRISDLEEPVSWVSLVAQMVKNLPVMQETWVSPTPGWWGVGVGEVGLWELSSQTKN